MTQVPVINVQPEVSLEEAIKNLIRFEKVKSGNIGLEKLYELVGCKSRMIERVWIANLEDGHQLHLIIDEEGTFGQWDRGVQIFNQDGYKHTLLGNMVFVKATPDGDWIGWDSEAKMADDIRPYTFRIKFFELGNVPA